jgi:hypothetical protein
MIESTISDLLLRSCTTTVVWVKMGWRGNLLPVGQSLLITQAVRAERSIKERAWVSSAEIERWQLSAGIVPTRAKRRLLCPFRDSGRCTVAPLDTYSSAISD